MPQCAKNVPFFPAPAEVQCPSLAVIACLARKGRAVTSRPALLEAWGAPGDDWQDEGEAAGPGAHRARP